MKLAGALATGGQSLVYQKAAQKGVPASAVDKVTGWNQSPDGTPTNTGPAGANTTSGATLGGQPIARDAAGNPAPAAAPTPSYAMGKYGIPDTHPVAEVMNRYHALAGDNADPMADHLLAAAYQQ